MDYLKNAAVEYGKQQLSGNSEQKHQETQEQQLSNSSLPGNPSGLSGILLNNNIMDFLDSDSDKKQTATTAAHAAGTPSETSLFHSVLNNLNNNKHTVASNQDPIDQDLAVRMFKKFIEKNDPESESESGAEVKASSDNLGAAAAMQAIKLFNSSNSDSLSSSSGQATLLSLAMSEGSKLFENAQTEGKVDKSTTKESVMQQAVQFILKFFLKSQSSGKGSNGDVNLLSLASQLL